MRSGCRARTANRLPRGDFQDALIVDEFVGTCCCQILAQTAGVIDQISNDDGCAVVWNLGNIFPDVILKGEFPCWMSRKSMEVLHQPKIASPLLVIAEECPPAIGRYREALKSVLCQAHQAL